MVIELHQSLLRQVDVPQLKITYVLTRSTDQTAQILQENNLPYTEIEPKEFSHSLTREKFALQSDADILVFITQDIYVADDSWLSNLIKPIIASECEAAFSRQVSRYKGIEQYTREFNYPAVSFVNTSTDLATKGMKAFAFSDAAGAVKTTIFRELGGYDGLDLPSNEDMYLAYKIITHGYRIKYCADSIVYHSHHFTLKQLYHRYYLSGQALGQIPELNQYDTTKAGGGLAKYVLKRALKKFDILTLLRFVPDMAARYLGMKKGLKSISQKGKS